jgi:hypothetical protein
VRKGALNLLEDFLWNLKAGKTKINERDSIFKTMTTIPTLCTLAAKAISKEYSDQDKLTSLLFDGNQTLILPLQVLEILLQESECSERILALLSKHSKNLETFNFCSTLLTNGGMIRIGGTIRS